MDKRQTVWLIVRLIGIYFAYWAVVALIGLVGAIYTYISLPSPNTPPKTNANTNTVRPSVPTPAVNPTLPTTKSPADEAAEKAKSDAGKDALWHLFLTVIYGGIGFYLIRNGRRLFVILRREDLIEDTDENVPLPAKKEKINYSSERAVKKEEVTSLNLSEYVPKSQRIDETEVKDKSSEIIETVNETVLSAENPVPETIADEVINEDNAVLEIPPINEQATNIASETSEISDSLIEETQMTKDESSDVEIVPPADEKNQI